MVKSFFLKTLKRPLAYLVCLLSLLWAIALGDGKQHVIDLWGASQTISLYIVFRFFVPAKRTVSRFIETSWFVLLAYISLRALFSLDIGLSLYFLLRYFEAYVVFSLFYEYGDLELEKNILTIIQILAITLSFVVAVGYFIQGLPHSAPPMNMFFNTYGHNHAVNLILIAIPVVFLQKNKLTRFLSLVILLVGLAFSLSRVAYLVVAGFFLAEEIHKYIMKKTTATKAAAATVVVSAAAVGAALLVSSGSLNLPRTTNKQTLLENNRFLYMRQALDAFREKPLLGYGPGTFSLLSKKYQPYQLSYSWFSHSYPLEILSELGVVGLVLMMIVIMPVFIKALSKAFGPQKNGRQKTVSWVLIMLIVYSVVEYIFNYLIIWLMFWALAGLLTSHKQDKKGPYK